MPAHPAVKSLERREGSFALDESVCVAGEEKASGILCRWLQDEFRLAVRTGAGARAIKFASVEGMAEEAYEIEVGRDGVRARASSDRGLIWAAATLVELVEKEDASLRLPCCLVKDEPHKPVRGVHVYVPGRDHVPFFKRYVRDFLARYKLNTVIMEVGGGVRLHGHPEVALGWRKTVEGWYALGESIWTYGEAIPLGPEKRFQASTHRGVAEGEYIEKEDLAEIVRFAREHGVDVIPEIQSLSHAYYLVCPHPELAELPEAAFPDSYCPSNPKSYRLLFEVMDEYVEIMRPKAVHIGHDEWRAGAFCPKCEGKDTGELFAEDVICIWKHLHETAVETWMWGDHFIPKHNERARSSGKGGRVWYDHPSTEGARERVAKETEGIIITDWSWSLDEHSEALLADAGFGVIFGNFSPARFKDWKRRSAPEYVLGSEVSSWCAMEEFELGKMNVAPAFTAGNMLWTGEEVDERACAERLPRIKSALAYKAWGIGLPRGLPSVREGARAEALDVSSALGEKAGPEGELSSSGLPVKLAGRRARIERDGGALALDIKGEFESLIFFWAADKPGHKNVHAGDQTHFPRDSSEPLALLEFSFADQFVLTDAARYDENLSAFDSRALLYHAPYHLQLPGGGRLWGYEWVNPRPHVPLAGVKLRGTGAWPEKRKSEACVMLYAVTAVERERPD